MHQAQPILAAAAITARSLSPRSSLCHRSTCNSNNAHDRPTGMLCATAAPGSSMTPYLRRETQLPIRYKSVRGGSSEMRAMAGSLLAVASLPNLDSVDWAASRSDESGCQRRALLLVEGAGRQHDGVVGEPRACAVA